MTLPGFSGFIRPVLEEVAENVSIESPRRVLLDLIAKRLHFTQDEVAERLPGGGSRLASRCGWALTYLTKAGLVSSPRRGMTQITPLGNDFLKKHVGPIKISDLLVFDSFRAFQQAANKESESETNQNPEADLSVDPEQRIESGVREIRASISDELLEILSGCRPTFFEILILDLMGAMGYGGKSGKLEHTGGSGDFGIDGIIHMDRLGLEKIFVQAKRWKAPVGRPDVQSFFGALAGKKARKGVMITTSRFTDEALSFAETVSDSLILVDGKHLTSLMIDFGVGVSNKKTLHLPDIDRDYFE